MVTALIKHKLESQICFSLERIPKLLASQPAMTCLKLIIETLEQVVIYVQS